MSASRTSDTRHANQKGTTLQHLRFDRKTNTMSSLAGEFAEYWPCSIRGTAQRARPRKAFHSHNRVETPNPPAQACCTHPVARGTVEPKCVVAPAPFVLAGKRFEATT